MVVSEKLFEMQLVGHGVGFTNPGRLRRVSKATEE
jgi:hypothetical protein